jgi:hypothetical protein
VAVKDEKAGTVVRFTPIDESSLKESAGFFKDVWSPDDEKLILPLGRYEGFVIFHATTALQDLAQNRFNQTIAVELKSGTRLWHQFRRWRGGTCVEFDAGLSGVQTIFTYSLSDRTVATRSQSSELVAIEGSVDRRTLKDVVHTDANDCGTSIVP